MAARVSMAGSEELTLFDRLLYEVLPALLHEHVCRKQALSLQTLLIDKRAEAEEIIDELDNCAEAACDFILTSDGEIDEAAAEQAERVGTMARHLAQHLARLELAPKSAYRHLARAAQIAAGFARYADDSGVLH
jgi:hypothetical protein